MKLFHGTSKESLATILADGIMAPSYWGTEEMARGYAESFGADSVILIADIDESYLTINAQVAQTLYDNGDLDEMPEPGDLAYSLENLEGVVCEDTITDFDVMEIQAPAKKERRSIDHDCPQP